MELPMFPQLQRRPFLRGLLEAALEQDPAGAEPLDAKLGPAFFSPNCRFLYPKCTTPTPPLKEKAFAQSHMAFVLCTPLHLFWETDCCREHCRHCTLQHLLAKPA